jgi:hypothetical protein
LEHVSNNEGFHELTNALQQLVHLLCGNAIQVEFELAFDGAEILNVARTQRAIDFKVPD